MLHLKDIISEINVEHTCYNCGKPVDINEAGFKFVIREKKLHGKDKSNRKNRLRWTRTKR